MTGKNSHPDQDARMDQLHRYKLETVHGVKQDVVFNSYPEWITVQENLSTDDYVKKIVGWHHDRNLIDGSTDKDQFAKLIQEAGELSDNICKGEDVSDDIGDMIVVLLNIAERNKLSLADCLSKAWDDIKDRKGRMVDGIFIKETDL
tara:strand:- start:208 stop:648 length:441 start_codon:yes stop_codon:yes gene_type:complete